MSALGGRRRLLHGLGYSKPCFGKSIFAKLEGLVHVGGQSFQLVDGDLSALQALYIGFDEGQILLIG